MLFIYFHFVCLLLQNSNASFINILLIFVAAFNRFAFDEWHCTYAHVVQSKLEE